MGCKSFFEKGKTIVNKIRNIFHPSELSKIAYKTGFIQRSTSRLQAEDFVNLMSVASIDPKIVPLEGLCSTLRELNEQADITPQSLMERVNNPAAAEFLKQVFQQALERKVCKLLENVPPDLLNFFGNIWVEDCSECALNESLQEAFKGSGGGASKASVKLDLIYEIKQKNIHSVDLVDRRSPDQKLAKKHLKIIQKGDLMIRDLGFFDVDVLRSIDGASAFFLSRLPASVNVYLNQEDEQPIDLGTHLKTNFPDNSIIDINIFVSKSKLPCRLIAYRAPQELADSRRRKAHKTARKKGGMPTKENLARLDFTFFITNVPADIWKAEVIGTIYKIRWEIELIFKNWKSSLCIHYLKGIDEHRIRCLLYGRLLAIVAINMIYQLTAWYAEKIGREISLHKVVNWLKKDNHLKKIIMGGAWAKFLQQLEREISKTLCKDKKRKRKTTASRLKTAEPYTNLYLQIVEIQKLKAA